MSYTPRYTNLVTLFYEATRTFANQPLFGTRSADGWHWITNREFSQLADRTRAAIAGLDVSAGDRVAVISNNRLEWAAAAYGTYTLAATYVPMYEAQLDKEWLYILKDCGAKLCFVANTAIAERIERLRGELPALAHVVNLDSGWNALLESAAGREVPAVTPKDSDIASLIYTSGTTGKPKGVMLTHRNLAANVSGLAQVAPVQAGDVSLAFLPWAHVFGGSIELNTVLAIGGSMAICGDTAKLIDYLPEVKPTMLFAVPRIWNRIYDGVQKQIAGRPKAVQQIFALGLSGKTKRKRGQPLSLAERVALPLAEKLIFSKVVQRFGGRLRFAFSGAAALSAEVAEFIDNLGINVYEGYGMTESSGTTTANLPGACKFGSAGKPIPGVEVRLDQSVAGGKPGEGEILIYGTGVMAGYYNQPEATRAAITEDGGLRSGDLGRFDADGFLFITGRVKELYKLQNGKYVAPVPLEEQLQLSPFIAQCVVYGEDQPHNVALVVPDMAALSTWAKANGVPDDGPSLLTHPRVRGLIREEIDKYSREFKGYETVRDFVLEGEEFTTDNDMLTPTLKMKRRNVLARHEGRLKALYQ